MKLDSPSIHSKVRYLGNPNGLKMLFCSPALIYLCMKRYKFNINKVFFGYNNLVKIVPGAASRGLGAVDCKI